MSQNWIYRFQVHPANSFPVCVDKLFLFLGTSAEAEFPSESKFEQFRTCLEENGFLLKGISRTSHSGFENVE